MDTIFDACVHLLVFAADMLGISYEALNVIVFCMIVPAVFAYLLWKNSRLKGRVFELSGGEEGLNPEVGFKLLRGFRYLGFAGTLVIMWMAFYIARLP